MQIPTEKLSESRNLSIKRKNYTTEDHLETKKQRIGRSLSCKPISFNSVSDTRYRRKGIPAKRNFEGRDNPEKYGKTGLACELSIKQTNGSKD